MVDRAAGVEQQRIAIRDQLGRAPPNQLLGRLIDHGPRAERRAARLINVGGDDSAAMHADDPLLLGQGVQIVAHGALRDAQLPGDLRYAERWILAHQAQQPLSPLEGCQLPTYRNSGVALREREQTVLTKSLLKWGDFDYSLFSIFVNTC